jgi:fatty acid synthase subunit alpha, fungi type
MSEMMTTNSLVKIKETPPYSVELERRVLLNSMARATLNAKTGSYVFSEKQTTIMEMDTANTKALSEMAHVLAGTGSATGVGIDHGAFPIVFEPLRLTTSIELISSVPSWNPIFVDRNFTEGEIAYCRSQPSPQSSFAARWTGKEAVFKSLGVSSKGAGAAMKDIEILPDENGVPTVTLHGDAKTAAQNKGIKKVLVSLSHSEVRYMVISLNVNTHIFAH